MPETGPVHFLFRECRMTAAHIVTKGARAVLPLVLFAAAACDDGLGPQFWDPTPDTTAVYSLSRPELIGQPSAYDFVSLRRVVIEAAGETGNWDVALGEEGGVFKLYPSGSLPGISSRAGIATTTSATLEGLERAPGDTAAYSRVPITAQIGTVYAVRSRTASCVGFGSGTYYGKFMILSIDPAVGSALIAAVRNPYCNDRSLIPPEN
jgi:hypothetical protein